VAAKGGDQGAAKKRDEIAAKLDADKLAAAEAAVAQWRAKTPDPVANGDLSRQGGRKDSSASNSNSGNPDMTGSIEATPARNDLALAQAYLMKLGYNPGSSDGLMGPRTHEALVAYQRSAGLEQTGNVNPVTLKSLEIATH
jgi:localization factor PodJL